MHCPQCGQQQNSDKIRFCTKCGLDLSEVKDLLTFGAKEKIKRKNAQNKAVRQGFVMIIAGLAIAMILGALHENVYIPKIAIILPLVFFMLGGVLRMVLPVFSGESNLEGEKNDSFINDLKTSKLKGEQISEKKLPEAEFSPPLEFSVKKYDTNELAAPPSVIEETTRQLEKEFQ